jgi:hypothetical protein
MIFSIGTGVKQDPSTIAKNIVQLAKDTLVQIVAECEEENNIFRMAEQDHGGQQPAVSFQRCSGPRGR